MSPARTVRAYEQLADRLRERILVGELQEGERLPSEKKLAEEAQVSRSTVRESLRTLQEAGLIERASPKIMVVRGTSGSGAFHATTRALRHHNLTFGHLHEALLTLEPELTRLATERCDRADLRALREIVEAQERTLERYDVWSRLDQDFHLAIAEMAGNPALMAARVPLTELLITSMKRLMREPAQTQHATRYHHRILFEVEACDPELATAVVRRHVNDFRIAWEKAGLDVDLQVADPADLAPRST